MAEFAAILLIITLAALYLLRHAWHTYTGKSTGCHCENDSCTSNTDTNLQ